MTLVILLRAGLAKVIYRNKYTVAVGFDTSTSLTVSSSTSDTVSLPKLANTGIFFVGNHLKPDKSKLIVI
jgi:hypothetical protein